jgi:hypothetical protein
MVLFFSYILMIRVANISSVQWLPLPIFLVQEYFSLWGRVRFSRFKVVPVFFYLTGHHDMKVYQGSEGIAPHIL